MVTFFYFSLAVMVIYLSVVVHKFGVPASLSESYYLFGGGNKAIALFFGFTVLTALPLMIFWLDISEGTFQPLVFLGCAALIFTGAAGAFRQGLDITVHKVSAAVCVVLTQLWVALYTPFWIFSVALICFLHVVGRKVPGVTVLGINRPSLVFFLEVAAFFSVYFAVFAYYYLTLP